MLLGQWNIIMHSITSFRVIVSHILFALDLLRNGGALHMLALCNIILVLSFLFIYYLMNERAFWSDTFVCLKLETNSVSHLWRHARSYRSLVLVPRYRLLFSQFPCLLARCCNTWIWVLCSPSSQLMVHFGYPPN